MNSRKGDRRESGKAGRHIATDRRKAIFLLEVSRPPVRPSEGDKCKKNRLYNCEKC